MRRDGWKGKGYQFPLDSLSSPFTGENGETWVMSFPAASGVFFGSCTVNKPLYISWVDSLQTQDCTHIQEHTC